MGDEWRTNKLRKVLLPWEAPLLPRHRAKARAGHRLLALLMGVWGRDTVSCHLSLLLFSPERSLGPMPGPRVGSGQEAWPSPSAAGQSGDLPVQGRGFRDMLTRLGRKASLLSPVLSPPRPSSHSPPEAEWSPGQSTKWLFATKHLEMPSSPGPHHGPGSSQSHSHTQR